MIAMYVSICVHSNPYYVASCSPRPSFSATMTDAGTHALLKKWADAVARRTVHRGVYSPDSTRTVCWPSLENCAWSTLDTPVALVKLTHPGVAQPHSLTDPLLSLFDNNPNLQAIVLQLHDSDARAVVEHVKKSCGGPNRGMSLYLREWEMQDGSAGIHVSGDVAAGWRKWECKAQQVQRGHWEDTAPLYSLHSQSPWSWHANLEGHTLPTWYKGTGMHPSVFIPLTTTPLFGVEHHRVSIPVDVVDHRHVDALKDFKQWGHAFQSGFISVNWMDKLQDEYGELRADAGLNIFDEDWPAETRAGDSDTRRTLTPPEGGAMYSFAREVLIPHLETHLGWKCPVVNVTTFIVVKAGTVDVEKKHYWHRDINLSYVAGRGVKKPESQFHTPTPVCGNLHFLRYWAVSSKYWRSILAVYFGVYGRILRSIQPYTWSIRGLSASHPCHHSHQLPPPPLHLLMTLQPPNTLYTQKSTI